MDARKLAEKIFSDIQGGKTTTTSILRDARALGKLLKTNDFDWVENELKSYDDPFVAIPSYRTVDAIDKKTWTGVMPPTLLSLNSDWLYNTNWVKWTLPTPVSVLEDLKTIGITMDTGTLLKTLTTSYTSKNIFQRIEIQPREIKRILDLIQDRVQSQIADYLAKPTLSKPSLAILQIYSELFPEISGDIEIVVLYLENGDRYVDATRSSRSILQIITKSLITANKPNGYVFTDGRPLSEFGEKSKMKYYLEKKGHTLHKDSKRLLPLDEIYRSVYDLGSKALKDKVNRYEANLCIDGLLTLLEKLYRYTDLKSIA
jgi:hypothetical protein